MAIRSPLTYLGLLAITFVLGVAVALTMLDGRAWRRLLIDRGSSRPQRLEGSCMASVPQRDRPVTRSCPVVADPGSQRDERI